MENAIFSSIPALILRIVAVAFLYVVNIFYGSYKYNRKLTGHYESLKESILLSIITGVNDIKDFGYLFETIKTDKIEFEEAKMSEKVLELLKPESKKKET